MFQKFLFACLFAACMTAQANSATVQYASPGVANGVTGLEFNGAVYNVDFYTAMPLSGLAGNLDFTTEADAAAASLALNDVFATEGVNYATNGSLNFSSFGIVFGVSATLIDYVSGFIGIAGYYTLGQNPCTSCGHFIADFEEITAVPVPAGGILLLSGLVVIGAGRRMRRRGSTEQA